MYILIGVNIIMFKYLILFIIVTLSILLYSFLIMSKKKSIIEEKKYINSLIERTRR